MRFQPLTYRPQTRRKRLADQLRRFRHRISMWSAGLAPYDDARWQFMCTLERRSVLARHIYVLIATDERCPRTAPAIAQAVNVYRREMAAAGEAETVEEVTEAEVTTALEELYQHGLTDMEHRLRYRLDVRG
ncbi:MAG: hypothetical protein RLZZ387_2556 [Chloroflexota bacterium]|jgi:hypothetical protein